MRFVGAEVAFTLFSYLLLTPVRSVLVSIASPRRINTHRMASLNGRQLWPISPSLSCALSFFLFCLIDSEPATLLSPSKSFAIPYGSSSRRRLTPFLDRSVSVHRSGGCAINSRQPVTPISLHRASSLRDATLVLFSLSLLSSNSRARTHCRRYSMDHTVRPFLFASLTPVILP